MKINIRFLRQGLVSVNAPDNIDTASAQDIGEWADQTLRDMSDREIIDAMADFDDPARNGYFDEMPGMSAIEQDDGTTIISTDEWDFFSEGSGREPFRV